MNQYEAMFVFDPTFGSTFDKCEAEVRRLMERAQAEIILCRKWDERRLAYRVKGRKRGVYAIVYFKAPPQNIKGLERDAQLSENILRLLVLRADHMTLEAMEQAVEIRQETQDYRAEEGPPPRRERRRGGGRSDELDVVDSPGKPKTDTTKDTVVVEPPAGEGAETV